jgi:hypothetical protein
MTKPHSDHTDGDETEDSELIRRVIAGDTECFRVLVERYERYVFAVRRRGYRRRCGTERVPKGLSVPVDAERDG